MRHLILKDGSEFEVQESDIIDWQRTYKNIDVTHEIDRMRQWLDANPAKRKTRRGAKRFINSWLSRANEQIAAGRSVAIKGLKPQGIDCVTDVSWLDGEQRQLKAQQYLKQFGSYWDGERCTNIGN